MGIQSKCPSEMDSLYRPILSRLGVHANEIDLVLPAISVLDAQDGQCDGKISTITSEGLKQASEHLTSLQLPLRRRFEICDGIWKLVPDTGFANFIDRPYHDVLTFIEKNPFFAQTLLTLIQPKTLTTPELDAVIEKMKTNPAEGANGYAAWLQGVYDRSGLTQINALIARAEQTKTLEESEHPSAAEVMLGRKTSTPVGSSSDKLLQQLAVPKLPDFFRVDPTLLPMLYRHKSLAEAAFVRTVLDMADTLPDQYKNDPFLYWNALAKLATLETDVVFRSMPSHVEVMTQLYNRANSQTYDRVMQILFEVEFADFCGRPEALSHYDRYIAEIRKAITELNGKDVGSFKLPNAELETRSERIARYYSAIGHLLTRKYGTAVSEFSPKQDILDKIEFDLDRLLRERSDKATVGETLVYADTLSMVASAWAAEGGFMSQSLVMGSLGKAQTELGRLTTLLKRFETICNGHFAAPDGGDRLREKMADIRWKILGETYFRAGLPRQGFLNLDSEPLKFRMTETYRLHIQELAKRYPWLVDKAGKLTLENVGRHGEEAYHDTKALFLISQNNYREVGLPMVGAAVGSLGGPLGTVAGGYAGKVANYFVNISKDDAETILAESKATGIPLVSGSIADQLNTADNIDWLSCGVSSAFMFRFYRSFVSLAGHGAAASWETMSHVSFKGLGKPVFEFNVKSSLGAGKQWLMQDVPNFVRNLPVRAAETYGESGALQIGRLLWDQHGMAVRLTGATAMLASGRLIYGDYNNLPSTIGASLFVNDLYGKLVWGWNPVGGMSGFFWRYGFELGVQAMQGVSIAKPRMDYTLVGMFVSYTNRGVNRTHTLGRAEVHSSPVLSRLAHFVEERNVVVPQSVSGRSNIKGQYGLVRGLAVRVGKSSKALSPELKDGTVLNVSIGDRANGHYHLRVVRKVTVNSKAGEAVSELQVPRASEWGRRLSRTLHFKLSDAWMYRGPDWAIRRLSTPPAWWARLGNKASTTSKPIYNLRGSLANAGDLPLIFMTGMAFARLQDADPMMSGAYRAADYGMAFFLQHKIQHMLMIDGVLSTSVGYFLGIPACIYFLPKVFPTVINKAPGISKAENGYFAQLATGHDNGANQALQSALTSLTFLHNAPVVGEAWNTVSPFGAVNESWHRIEEAGAIAYWRQMIKMYNDSNSNNEARRVMEHFVDKVARDAERFLVRNETPEDPVSLRLFSLELAFAKRMMGDNNQSAVMRYANSKEVLRGAIARVPQIRTDRDLQRFVKGLNVDKVITTF